jgi:hypothetical protein
LAISFSDKADIVIEAKLVELPYAPRPSFPEHHSSNFTAFGLSDEDLDEFLTDIYADFSTPR